MPRSGPSNTYSLPPIYLAVPGTPIIVDQHNTPLEDIADTFNEAWPVNFGGTGGTSAITAWDAINVRGTDIPTAGTVDLTLATGPNLHFTGTTTVTTVSLANGAVRFVTADAAFLLTASATLVVNGATAVNYVTTAGDLLIFIGGASSVVRVYSINGGTFRAGVGTASAPSITFAADTSTGLYYNTGVGVAVGGAAKLLVNASGTNTTGQAIVNGTGVTPLLWLLNNDPGASDSPLIDLDRDSISPLAADGLGALQFYGKDSAGNKQLYASITTRIEDPTSAAEYGSLAINAVGSSVLLPYLYVGRNAAGTMTMNALGLPRGQLSFPATQNASSDANTLDDYEEGTFVPTIAFGGGSTGVTYGSRSGAYTKTGNQVTFTISMTLTAEGTSNGSFTIEGLPFTCAAATAVSVGTAGNFTGLTGALQASIGSGATAIDMKQSTATGNANIDRTNTTDTTTVRVSGSYLV